MVLVLAAAFSFGAITSIALAGHYHTNCVGHGLQHGSSTTDQSYFSRVQDGCPNGGLKTCQINNSNGNALATDFAGQGEECRIWSQELGFVPIECQASVDVDYDNAFESHRHFPHC